jgi:hypothetical protein
MLKNVSEVILVTKNIFFLKILNFVQSFVECNVSLADGTLVETTHPGSTVDFKYHWIQKVTIVGES